MTTFIKKFKKSNDQTNIDKFRVAANITEYHSISKLIFLRIINAKFMKIRQIFHVNNVKKSTCLKWTYGLFGNNYQIATLSTLYLTVSRTYRFESDFDMTKLINQKDKNSLA